MGVSWCEVGWVDECVLMLDKGEVLPDDPLTVMVKEKVRGLAGGFCPDGQRMRNDCTNALPFNTFTLSHTRPHEQMTRKQMYSHLVTMLAAGHDTTAFCTCYTLFLLAKNPEVCCRIVVGGMGRVLVDACTCRWMCV